MGLKVYTGGTFDLFHAARKVAGGPTLHKDDSKLAAVYGSAVFAFANAPLA